MVNQALPEKGCGFPCKFCFTCMIIYNIVVLLFIFINLCLQDWIYQGEDHLQFKGNLIQLYEAGDIFPEDTYDAVAEDLSDKADQYLDDSFNQQFYEEYEKKFNREYIAGVILIIFSVIGMIGFLVALGGYLFTFLKTTVRIVGAIGATVGGVFFCLGAILYLVFSYADFSNDCEDLIESDDDEVVIVRSCRGGAAYFLLVNFFVALVFSIITCSIMCCGLREDKSYEGVRTSSRGESTERAAKV